MMKCIIMDLRVCMDGYFESFWEERWSEDLNVWNLSVTEDEIGMWSITRGRGE
jgi:hypothetical protein